MFSFFFFQDGWVARWVYCQSVSQSWYLLIRRYGEFVFFCFDCEKRGRRRDSQAIERKVDFGREKKKKWCGDNNNHTYRKQEGSNNNNKTHQPRKNENKKLLCLRSLMVKPLFCCCCYFSHSWPVCILTETLLLGFI